MSGQLILCVDDEKIILDSLMLQLRNNFSDKFELEFASSGEEALEILKELIEDKKEIPLIISDYLMPGMKGDIFLSQATKLSPSTFGLMLTGQATLSGVTYALNNSNLFNYMEKPWNEENLILTINKAVASYENEKNIILLSEKNEQLYKRMKQYFVSTITPLSNAIDARDSYTIGHSKRVTEYSLVLGKEIGLSEERLENLRYMAILHDIGKIGICDDILLKADKLTDNEFETMKQHVTIGQHILSEIEDFEPIMAGICYHHEKFDGSGYVHNLCQTNIPLEARIICLADSFDAMTTTRPYRKSMTVADAVDEIQKNSGTQFDPELSKIFVDLIYREKLVQS